MLADMESGHIDAVIAWHPDRLYRQPRELEDLMDLLDSPDLNVELRTVTAGAIKLATSDERMLARIQVAIAKREVEHKAERIQRTVTEEPEPVREPEKPQEPLTQREQMDLIVRALYDSLGDRRPTTKLMTDALEKAGLPSSDGTARESRKRVEAAEPHLKTLPSALAA
jgi:DNA invertase Pin-like site-specific DNA recombinase